MADMIMWSPGVTLESIEKQVILKAYDFYRKNKVTTANALGIAKRTLDAKLEKYDADEKAEGIRHADDRQKRHELLAKHRYGQSGRPAPQGESNQFLPGASAGVHVESAPDSAPKQPVSVQVRQEVQEMSPKPAPKSVTRKAGG